MSGTLHVESGSVSGLRDVFAGALDQVNRQIELARNDLRVAQWAEDPVSENAAATVNNASTDTETSALDMLRAYQGELNSAVSTLDATAKQYHLLEQDNSITLGRQGGPGQG
jgi:hypothetical protein